MSPHFPPDTSAGTHRVRLLAPHLPFFGWEPTVLTVEPRYYEGRLDWDLLSLVPEKLRVVRCGAVPARWSRKLGIGDLGLRSLGGLYRKAVQLLSSARFDALFVTIYPAYTALLGPMLKRKFGIPFVLDYQDPWVGQWGLTVGGGADGRPDFKSRASRALAVRLEPWVVRYADAVTAVSCRTYEDVMRRNSVSSNVKVAEIPLGAEPRDFERCNGRRPSCFDPHDGYLHACYVGTLLPLGFEPLEALFGAAAFLREREPGVAKRLRFHFVGTSNRTSPLAPPRVLPVAARFGIEDCVFEVPQRVDYLDALAVLRHASFVLLLGSTEAHYSPSKVYPALLSRRPLLAFYHEASNVVPLLREAVSPESLRLVVFGDRHPPSCHVESLARALADLISIRGDAARVNPSVLKRFSAREMARRLARVLDSVAVTGS